MLNNLPLGKEGVLFLMYSGHIVYCNSMVSSYFFVLHILYLGGKEQGMVLVIAKVVGWENPNPTTKMATTKRAPTHRHLRQVFPSL
jgi:hypothetical protein